MLYRIDQITKKAVEEFNTLPNFHADVMANIIESSQVPTDNDIWNGTEFVPKYTEAELLVQAKMNKYSEIWAYADKLNQDAENTFITNSGANAKRTEKRNNKKHSKLSNKKLKGQNLTDAEDEWFDKYDELLDHQDSVYDIADLAADDIEDMNNVDDVNNYDVANTPDWPVYN